MKKVYISVFDNSGILDYIKVLAGKFDYEIVSSGRTFEYLKANGVTVLNISELEISESLEDSDFLGKFVAKNFDMVIINFRPVSDIVDKTDDIKQFIQSVELLDFSILRAAARHFEDTIVVTACSEFYNTLNVNLYERQQLALNAFQYLSDYDELIADKIGVYSGDDERKLLNLTKLNELKYGSNPHQRAALYKSSKMADYIILNDKELSYNDILNMNMAVGVASEFYDVCAAVIVKHNLPCGVALGSNIYEAYTKAFDCDPFATFCGTIAFSQTVNYEIAKQLTSMSVKLVIAPYYEYDALKHLIQNSDLKIVRLYSELKDFKNLLTEQMNITPFGTLVEEANKSELDKELFKVVTKVKPTTEELEDAIFAWKVAKFSRTNSVVVAKDFKTVAISQGHTNIVCAVESALDVACENSKGAVLAADEALVSGECVNAAAQGRISLIIQPGGALRDREVIQVADKLGIAMVFTGIRNLRF